MFRQLKKKKKQNKNSPGKYLFSHGFTREIFFHTFSKKRKKCRNIRKTILRSPEVINTDSFMTVCLFAWFLFWKRFLLGFFFTCGTECFLFFQGQTFFFFFKPTKKMLRRIFLTSQFKWKKKCDSFRSV